jgi:hypothetical protein
MNATTNPVQIQLARRSPAYWRVSIDNPPINVSRRNLACVGMPTGKGRLLQFDDRPGGKMGLPRTIRAICAVESRTIKVAYYPIFIASPKYSLSLIKNLIACYRFFKEIRSSQIHNGGFATKEAAEAFKAFALVSDKAALGMKGELIYNPIVKGDKDCTSSSRCSWILRHSIPDDCHGRCRALPIAAR